MKPDIAAARFCDHLAAQGYTHCFFVAGGNVMHLLDAARTRFTCVPVVHEVAAGIATEYFNEVSDGARAFALVTAGPGLTNILTAMGGAWLEGRELLVVGGQVKSTDLARGQVRQRGIQEIDGVALAGPITKRALRVEGPADIPAALHAIETGAQGRPGPVFIEFCLDAQASPSEPFVLDASPSSALPVADDRSVKALRDLIRQSCRPILLIGGGVDRHSMPTILDGCEALGLPIMTTWNGTDRVGADHALYWGRPNTWGQRSANVLIQQADLVIAAGTRLGLQQTGFNWQGFAPMATVVQIDVDAAELAKGHPHVDLPILADAAPTLVAALSVVDPTVAVERQSWLEFGATVRRRLPNNEDCNSRAPDYINPYDMVERLSDSLAADDIVIPCSSGGAFTVMMQAFRQKSGQRIVTDKGLASMGYGLSGAIGAAYARPDSRVVLVEGDGGFAQNLQELGTVAISGLAIKIFLFANDGYASIRMTQRNYFDGAWIGCDIDSGLGLPDWAALFHAYRIPCLDLGAATATEIETLLSSRGPAAFIVPIDPDQTYFPKITSQVLPDGSMASNPLHQMTPELPDEIADYVLRYIRGATHESH
jgi:acetolactate synthase-1/2/3 large subunit